MNYDPSAPYRRPQEYQVLAQRAMHPDAMADMAELQQRNRALQAQNQAEAERQQRSLMAEQVRNQSEFERQLRSLMAQHTGAAYGSSPDIYGPQHFNALSPQASPRPPNALMAPNSLHSILTRHLANLGYGYGDE